MAPLLEKEKLLFCSELYNAWAVGGNLTREELRGLAQCFQPDDKTKRLSKKEKKKAHPPLTLPDLFSTFSTYWRYRKIRGGFICVGVLCSTAVTFVTVQREDN